MKLMSVLKYILLIAISTLPLRSICQFVTSGVVSPSSQTISPGNTPAPLSVTAASGGFGAPPYSYSYQWESSTDGNNWTPISGATTGSGYSPGTLSVTTYYRLYTEQVGMQNSAYSNTVSVVVSAGGTLQPGSISPTSTTIVLGQNLPTFSGTAATGGNGTYAYQWQSSPDNSTWTNINEATSQNYSPVFLTSTTYFRRSVTSNGATQYSNVAIITVNPALQPGAISPTSIIIFPNTSPGQISGTVPTGGVGGYTYQWKKSSDGIGWADIAGATAQNYTPGILTTTTYFSRTVFSGQEMATTSSCVVTVIDPGIISPSSISINYNTSPGQLTGTLATGGNGTYAYQWQSSPNSSTWSNISGATSQNYAPSNLTATTYYRRQVTSNSVTVSSNVSTITVYPQLQAGSVTPATLSINYNTSPGQLTGTVATGGNGTYAYQWQSSADNSTWTNITGASSQNYSPSNLAATTYFRRQVTSNSVTLNSSVSMITVYAQLQAGSVTPTALSINYNTAPGQLTGTVATGGNGTYVYQWQSSPNNSTWTNISGATSQNYTPSNLTATTYFRRQATSNGVTISSNVSIITVYPQLQAGVVTPATLSINYNTSPGQLAGTVATGGNGTYAYQWQSSPNNSTWTNISGATNQNYTPANLTATTYYRRQVTSNSITVSSNVSTVTVYTQLQAGSVTPTTVSINYNTSPGQLTGTAATGGNGTYMYQWQSSPNNSTWTNIAGITTPNYTPPNLISTTYYRRSVTSNGVTIQSNVIIVTVTPDLEPGSISAPVTPLNYNTAPAQITGSLPSGGTGAFAYQWQRSSDNFKWTNIANATSQNYTSGPLTVTTYFRRQVTSGETKFSNIVAVTVYPQLEGGILSPGSTTISTNTNPGILGVNPAVGGNGTYVYQWQSSDDNFTWSNISGATARDYNAGNLTVQKWFRRNVTSNTVTVSSNPILVSIRQSVAPLPGDFSPSMKVNYVRQWELMAPESNAANVSSRPLRDVKQMTNYSDGLGRPMQQVVKQGSMPTGGQAVDLVSTNLWDGMGRETRNYLPFAANSTGGNAHINDGLLKRNPNAQQAVFGSMQFPGESYFYRATKYDASPLEEVEKTEAAGNSWAGSGRGAIMKRFTNTTTDDVKHWNVTNVSEGFGTYAIAGTYAQGELFKKVATDENGRQNIEFTDKEGRIILKKIQLTASPDNGTGRDYNGWLCTYYIYDNIGNLRCVIPPKAVDLIRPSFQLTDATILSELCFRYEYDANQRMIKKTMPGAGETWMVYDAKDRMILSQDENLRKSSPVKWMFTQYDALDRQIATGLWNNSQSQSYHAAQSSSSTTYPDLTGAEVLTVTHYDDYDNLPAGFAATVNSSDASAFFTGPYNASPEYALPWSQSKQTIGLITWTQTKILGTSDFITSVHYYDDREQLIQIQTKNITGGIDIRSTQYSFSGKVLKSINRIVKAQGSVQNIPLCTKFTYDDLGRVTKVEHGQNFSGMKVVQQSEYDALGQVKMQKVGTTSSGTPLETLEPEYNIRGWLLGINRPYLKDSNSVSNYFGYDLGYDKDNLLINTVPVSYADKLFNGNIAGVVWKSTGDDQTRRLDYQYDAANRLLASNFTQLKGSGFNTTAGLDFSTRATAYDANGNITNMLQSGWKLGGSRVIDSLTYNYIPKSNRLKNVIDLENDTATTLSDFRASKNYINNLGGSKTSSATDYEYNTAGNIISDKNKDIGQIQYNFLGMPSVIKFPGKGTIEYLYDAKGIKLKKIVTDSIGQSVRKTTWLYMDEAVFQTRQHSVGQPDDFIDSLLYYFHPGGRVRIKNQTAFYDYLIKDHLGNVRMVLSEEQQTDAYLNASMETATAALEESYYYNINSTREDKPAGYPTDTYTDPNNKVARVRGDGQKIGPAILLRVMAGDKFGIRANSWYDLKGASPSTPLSPLPAIVSALAAIIPGVSAGKLLESQLTAPVLDPSVISFLNHRDQNNTTERPKAYLNYLLLDEQMNPVITNNGKNTGFEQVGVDKEFKTHLFTGREITKNGYLYIYVSNETPNINVYFDNLQVTHNRGPLLEEAHYYPSGLLMEGISSKAFGQLASKHKFNGGNELQDEEFRDGSGLELYDAQFRLYDPQLGRFHQIDPLGDVSNSISVYSFANGNPILKNDPLGLLSTPDNPHVLPDHVFVYRKLYKKGFHWKKAQKGEIDLFRSMKYKYDVRRRAGLPETSSGDSQYYLDNLASFRRRYEVEMDGRKMQVGAVAAIFAPVAGYAIAPIVPAIAQATLAEAGLIRAGIGIATKSPAFLLAVGNTAINVSQNRGDIRALDAFDVLMGAFFPAKTTGQMIGMAAVNSAVDWTPMQPAPFSLVGANKSVGTAAIDFGFGIFGGALNTTFGGGNNTVTTMVTDIITGQVSQSTQEVLKNNEKAGAK